MFNGKKIQLKRLQSDLRTNLHGYAREAQNGSMQCANMAKQPPAFLKS